MINELKQFHLIVVSKDADELTDVRTLPPTLVKPALVFRKTLEKPAKDI
jgi:hypothetical protein